MRAISRCAKAVCVYCLHDHSDPNDLLFISDPKEAPESREFDPESREFFLQPPVIGQCYHILSGWWKPSGRHRKVWIWLLDMEEVPTRTPRHCRRPLCSHCPWGSLSMERAPAPSQPSFGPYGKARMSHKWEYESFGVLAASSLHSLSLNSRR